ncbi:MAG: hypothetical protein ABJA60_07660 [Nitrosospira sp.]
MPESAIATGRLEYVLPIEELAQTPEQYIDHSSFWAPDFASPPTKEETQALASAKHEESPVCIREVACIRDWFQE